MVIYTSSITYLFLSSLLLCAVSFKSAYADEGKGEITEIKISVRTIQATNPLDSGQDGQEIQAAHVPEEISDLAPKLSQIPFSSFSLLESKEQIISLGQRETMQLPNGQSLVFRPMYMDNKRVGIWLNWKDKDGDEILNTRVHFDADDSVLTGTECAHQQGVILAIKATAIEKPAEKPAEKPVEKPLNAGN